MYTGFKLDPPEKRKKAGLILFHKNYTQLGYSFHPFRGGGDESIGRSIIQVPPKVVTQEIPSYCISTSILF